MGSSQSTTRRAASTGGARLLYVGGLAVAGVMGVLLGMVLNGYRIDDAVPVSVAEDSDVADVPVVEIDGLRDGALRGRITGDVRVIVRDHVALPDASGSFAVYDTSLMVQEITVQVPAGMNFVASKRGKKYYSVTSANGQNIVPENRIYFKTAQEAENAGYAK